MEGVTDVVLGKKMESLLLLSLHRILEEFRGIVVSLEKFLNDGKQQVKGCFMQPTMKQMQLRVGVKPCLTDCLDGLRLLL